MDARRPVRLRDEFLTARVNEQTIQIWAHVAHPAVVVDSLGNVALVQVDLNLP